MPLADSAKTSQLKVNFADTVGRNKKEMNYMKIELRQTKEPGIVQITTLDERWYHNTVKNIFRPSSTWISSYYPKGIAFYKWLANTGWDEAEALKKAGGNRGSKVHRAVEALLNGLPLEMTDYLPNPETGQPEELTVEEWECVMSFVDWYNEVKPEIIDLEQVVENKKYNYAGTQDLKCKINGEVWIVDFKTSAHVWPEMELQLSSYKHADKNKDVVKMGILQLNYKLNKRKFKFTEVPDKFHLFIAARQIWLSENEGVKPKQKDYPVTLKLENIKVAKVPKEKKPRARKTKHAKGKRASRNAKNSAPLEPGFKVG